MDELAEGLPVTDMKLLLVIIYPSEADTVVDTLLQNDFRVTRITSSGGFLRQDNVTLLVGVEEHRVNDALRIISGCCHPHAELESHRAGITKRRAMVFIMGVERAVGI
jgi:uncharacterized protein YaaQ